MSEKKFDCLYWFWLINSELLAVHKFMCSSVWFELGGGGGEGGGMQRYLEGMGILVGPISDQVMGGGGA